MSHLNVTECKAPLQMRSFTMLIAVDETKVECLLPVRVESMSDVFKYIDEVKNSRNFYAVNEAVVHANNIKVFVIHKDGLLAYMESGNFDKGFVHVSSLTTVDDTWKRAIIEQHTKMMNSKTSKKPRLELSGAT